MRSVKDTFKNLRTGTSNQVPEGAQVTQTKKSLEKRRNKVATGARREISSFKQQQDPDQGRKQLDDTHQGLGRILNRYRDAAHPDENFDAVSQQGAALGGIQARGELVEMRKAISDCLALTIRPSDIPHVTEAYESALKAAWNDSEDFDAAMRKLIAAVRHIDVGDRPPAWATMY